MVEVQNDLMNKVVELTSIEAISSTSIRVSWDILANPDHIEGFFIRYENLNQSVDCFCFNFGCFIGFETCLAGLKSSI